MQKNRDLGACAKALKILDNTWFLKDKTNTRTSVADPWHFGVDPDPRIHASDKWIRIRIRIRILAPDPAIIVIDLQDASKKLIF